MDGFKALFDLNWKTYVAGTIIGCALLYQFAVNAPIIFFGGLIGIPALAFFLWQRSTRSSSNPWE